MKKILVALTFATLSFGAFAQQRNFDAVQIRTTQVAPGIYMLEGEGGNIGVSAGEDGVFLIDDQFAPLTPKIVAAVKAISDKPIRFLMNTHWHGDHVGGNENLGKAGVVIIAHDNVYKRMSVGGAITALKQNYGPGAESRAARHHLHHDVDVSPERRRRDLDASAAGAYRRRFVRALHQGERDPHGRRVRRLPLSLHGPRERRLGQGRAARGRSDAASDGRQHQGHPGHGGLSSKKDVLAYRKMVSTAISKIEPMVKSGRTLQQVIDAKPLREFDEEWGKFRKPEAFVEIVYNGLKPGKK